MIAPVATPRVVSNSGVRRRLRQLRRQPAVIAGLVVIAAWFALAALAPVLAPYEPLEQNIQQRLQPPNP
ncbi:MAG: glutathione ABC transporter permease GsiD, partial [Trueperaceae bacterium]